MKTVYLLSKHQKAKFIAPILADISIDVVEIDSFDTDKLGTFSGEVERTMTPSECALYKAKKACQKSGSNIGIGSEGSFGGGPAPGFINWDQEILCFYQRTPEVVVYAHAEGPCSANNVKADSREDLLAALTEQGGQFWIYREQDKIQKELSQDQVLDLFEKHNSESTFEIEPDLRAHLCPPRQKMIQKAAQDLVSRLESLCPKCGAVNFVVKEAKPGLTCGLCGLPTKQIKGYLSKCDQCNYEEYKNVDSRAGDPTYCDYCNP
ncbi:MAG: hypothetical protein Alis3KO_38220 [Aliiglaciecola sp.]|uniref:DUF6671 family protein n=1 Tax=Aliiglaciecola sp. M165 TaxID=2593649 RepID=UPI00117E3119|nr:DUF6671 family protein [Aliiglaciecola sp. M165]TRY29034.1 hypothetical protein FM019_19725 [Aliiglaciecola sp. M165]